MNRQQMRSALNITNADPNAAVLWNQICDAFEKEEDEWAKKLIMEGFDAAHPNDGWVDRKNKKVSLVYPQFRKQIKIGSKIMLGWPKKNLRPVRVIKIENTWTGEKFWFEDLV